MADKMFDIKLIPELNNTVTGPQWLQGTELVYQMCGIKRLEHIPHCT